jgi:hypothetical protein
MVARVDELPTMYRRFDWWTEYSDKNDTEVDAMWDAISPPHGFIAVDHQWAKEQHWPDSMHLPSDHSKAVYLLEAYHMIHCLVSSDGRSRGRGVSDILQTIVRKVFWEAVRGADEYSFNPPHAGHCLDSLRQVR